MYSGYAPRTPSTARAWYTRDSRKGMGIVKARLRDVLEELRRKEVPQGRFTLVFLAAPGDAEAQIELTYNWDPEEYTGGRNFGHLAYQVDDIYEVCQRLMDGGVVDPLPVRALTRLGVRKIIAVNTNAMPTANVMRTGSCEWNASSNAAVG